MSTAVVEQPKLVAARRESSFATGLDKVPLEPNSTTAKPEVRHAGTRPSLPRNRPSLQGQLPLDHDQPFPSSALGLPTERKAPLFTPMEDEGHGHMQPFDQAFADSLKPETQHQGASGCLSCLVASSVTVADGLFHMLAFPIVHSQNMSSTAPSTPSQRPNSYSNESNETQRHESAVPSPQLASTMAASLCSIESGASSLTDPVSPAPSIVASGDRRVRQQSTSSSHKPVNLHGRRSSVISIAGFTELGSGESLAAPPTLSDAESHHWHTHSSTSRPRISSITNGNIMDAPFNGHASLPAPLLPTLNNLHSSTHMARIRSDPGYEIHLPLPPAEETASRSISPRNPLSTSGGGLSRSSTRTSATSSQMHRMSVSEQEQEEPDFNPLYLLLSNSTDPDLQIAFERAGLVIVPPRDTCPPTTEMLSNPEWVKSHAFRSDQSTSTTSRWISLGKHRSSITLNKGHISISDAASSASPRKADEPASKTVSPHLSATVAPLAAQSTPSPPLSHRSSRTSIAASVPFPTVASGDDEDEDEILIPFRPSPAPPRAITFSNETTVYRKKYASGSTTSSTAAARPRTKSKSKLPTKIKTPKWMQRVSFSKPFASPAAELARESPSPAPSTSSEETGATLAYEMLRLIAVDEPLWPWYNAPEQSPAGHIPQANHATTEASAEAHKFALSDEYDPIPATRNFMQSVSSSRSQLCSETMTDVLTS